MLEEDLFKDIKGNLSLSDEFYATEHEEMKDDLVFHSGYQIEHRDNRKIQLVFNQIKKFVNYNTAPIKQNPFIFGVSGKTGQDIDTINKINKYLSNCQEKSNAHNAYCNAFEQAVICGRGYVVVTNDYLNSKGLEQKLVIYSPKDPTSVFIDPASQEDDASDAGFGIIVDYVGKNTAKSAYGYEEGNDILYAPQKFTERANSIPVISYWTMSREYKDIIYLQDGSSMPLEAFIMSGLPTELVIGQRQEFDSVVDFYKVCGNQVITKTRLSCPRIPIVSVVGDTVWTDDGRITKKGIVHWLRDTQKAINFTKSAGIERTNLAPKSPYLLGLSQLMSSNKAVKDSWDSANTENRSYLLYDDTINANLPQRNNTSPMVAEFQASASSLQSDLYEISGISPEAFGAVTGNKSGVAIDNLQQLSEMASSGYLQSLDLAVTSVGRCYIPMLKDITQGSEVTFTSQDGKRIVEVVTIDELIDAGDVIVTASPTGKAQKRMATNMLIQLAQGDQEFKKAFADVIIENSGLDYSEEALNRAKKMVPSYLKDEEPDPEAMAVMQEMQNTIEQKDQYIKALESGISQLSAENIKNSDQTQYNYWKTKVETVTKLALEEMKANNTIEENTKKAITDFALKLIGDEFEQDKNTRNVEVNYLNPLKTFVPQYKTHENSIDLDIARNQGQPLA